MRLSPGTALFTVFLGALTAVGPLSTDMYLPSLPAIALAFAADTGATQLTLSAHLVGFAGSQLFYGPMSDRYGRRPVMLAGFTLYIAGCFASLFVASIEELIAARFFQAIGGGASVVLARAVVRDLYEGPAAGQMLARMAAIMGIVPALAPMLGGVIEAAYGWKMNFVAMGAFGAVLALIVLTSLDETLPPARRQSAAPRAILIHYRRLIVDRRYLRYLLIASPSPAAIVAPIMLYGFAVGLTMPQAMAGALTPFPEIAGTASALLGFLQAGAAAAVGVYVGHGVGTSAMPMIGTIALTGFLTFAVTVFRRREPAG